MRVGDLVQLSSYGVVREYNRELTRYGDADQVGLVTDVKDGRRSYPYRIKWTKVDGRHWSNHSRRELKYAHR